MNIVITGASKGIGKAVAEIFAANGNHIFFLCSRGERTLYQAVEELINRFPGSEFKAMPFDVTNRQEVEKFTVWLLENGGADILINNAGRFLPGSIFNEAPGVLEEMLDTNLSSVYHLTRHFLPSMMAK